jgi:DNA polymerase I-like protein with 3'-5' exonuclease and polymerase domains
VSGVLVDLNSSTEVDDDVARWFHKDEPKSDSGEILVVGDYKALEVVVTADMGLRLWGDDQLAKMIAPGAADIHCVNAQKIFGEYLGWTFEADKAFPELTGQRVDKCEWKTFKKHWYGKYLRFLIKSVWYGLSYGKSDYGFQTLEDVSGKMIGKKLAGDLVEGTKSAVPVMRKWHEWVANSIRIYGGIYTLGGRWLDLVELSNKDDWGFAAACRKGYNFPPQGTGAEIINDALVRVYKCRELRRLGFRTFIQVHDELGLRGPIINGPKAAEWLNTHMNAATANGIRLLVPLQTSIGMGYDYYTAK